MSEKQIDLSGKGVSGDDAMQKVIAAQAKAQDERRRATALARDREQLLEEYTDLQRARPVPKSPAVLRAPSGDVVRVSAGDMHGMRMDRPAVDAFLADLKTIAPDEVVLGGDILECGGWLAKHQPIGYVALADFSYQEDVLAACWFLDEVQKAAPDAVIHYVEGNHEDRVERWIVDQTMSNQRDADFLRKAFAPETLLRLSERGIAYYRRSEQYVDGAPLGWIKLGKMYFTHELGASRNAARDAVSRTAGNVTYFHTHREDTAARVFPSVGLVKAFNPGCLCTMQPVWQNSHPTDWSHGYAIDVVAKSGNFQRIQVPIWGGESLASAMVERFKS